MPEYALLEIYGRNNTGKKLVWEQISMWQKLISHPVYQYTKLTSINNYNITPAKGS